MFREIMSKLNTPLTAFSPCKNTPSFDAEWAKGSAKLGEKFLGFSWPFLSAKDYMDFSKTGDRSRYEDRYFSKRRALASLVIAEYIEDEGRFTEDIINGIFSICEESAWQLPAHNTYIRDATQLPLPDASEPILDLFACETGASLALTYQLLKKKLDAVSPFITKRIMSELDSRIITPYLTRHFWWMGNGRETMCNWTIWCTQNVLLVAFLTDRTDAVRRKVLEKACISTDYFLDEYGEDGCCDEGAQYYRHAALCLFNTIEILDFVSGGAFGVLYDEPKIKNIASYIFNVHVDGEYYVNFADCSPVAGRAGAREFLFAERTGNSPMADFAAADYLAGKEASLIMPDEINLYYRLQNGITASRIKSHRPADDRPAAPADVFYPSAGVFVARDDVFCLSVKAGDNADSHNHNDTGSFTIYKSGRPFLIDIGVETYTQKTFSAQRYEIWTMQSAWHNLPTVNGCMQKDGEEFCARDVSFSFSDDEARISMDIAAAYPAGSGIIRYDRSCVLLRGRHIEITDSFAFDDAAGAGSGSGGEIVISLMTYEKPSPKDASSGLSIDIEDIGCIDIAGGSLLAVEAIPINDGRLSVTWKHDIYRILIRADAPVVRFLIS